MLKLIKKYWWVLALIVAIAAAFFFLRHSARKKQAAEEAQQRRIDSLSIEAKVMDSMATIQNARIRALEASQQTYTDALAGLNKQRKNESHAYHKNISAVRALSTDEQVKLLADWLPKVDQ